MEDREKRMEERERERKCEEEKAGKGKGVSELVLYWLEADGGERNAAGDREREGIRMGRERGGGGGGQRKVGWGR